MHPAAAQGTHKQHRAQQQFHLTSRHTRTNSCFVLLCCVCCRDIKPENLLLVHPDGAPDGPEGLVLKVVDYGCSTFCVPGKRLCKKFGTVGFMSRARAARACCLWLMHALALARNVQRCCLAWSLHTRVVGCSATASARWQACLQRHAGPSGCLMCCILLLSILRAWHAPVQACRHSIR
jgi:hypothetical protein